MHKIVEQYQNELKKYEDCRLKLEILIKELLIQENINFHTVESRTKDPNKLDEKISRKDGKYGSIDEVTDLVGIRIITYFEDDVDRVAALIEKEFTKDKENSIDKRVLESDKFGYRSLHNVVSLDRQRQELSEYSRFRDIKFEVQIRSVLQHAWAEIEHDIGYKGEHAIPSELRRNFYRVAALLETADIEFVKIREKLESYENDIEERIKTSPGDVEIDAVSLRSFILSSRTVSALDRAISEKTQLPIAEGDIADQSNLERLSFVGIKTVKQLDAELKEKRQIIVDFSDIWIRSIEDDDDEVLDDLPQGISIFYLAYVLVSETGSLDFAGKYFEAVFSYSSAYAQEQAKNIMRIHKIVTSASAK